MARWIQRANEELEDVSWRVFATLVPYVLIASAAVLGFRLGEFHAEPEPNAACEVAGFQD